MQDYERRQNKIHGSLNEIHKMLGAPKTITILILTFGIAAAKALYSFYSCVIILSVTYGTIKFFAWASQRDLNQWRVYKRRTRFADFYDPWPKSKQKRGIRPLGMGRGMLK